MDIHVHTAAIDDVPEHIVLHAAELGVDLIVLCTHGRAGVRSWLFGNIAQQVLARSHVPVLLVHPGSQAAKSSDYTCTRILVALDGDPDHERGLEEAARLASICHATLHVLVVVPTRGALVGGQAAAARLLPRTVSAILDINESMMQRYLAGHLARLAEAGLKASGEVSRGDPADVIVMTARDRATDLIVLGTHAIVGQEALWAGSVTPKVAGRSLRPIMMVPIAPDV